MDGLTDWLMKGNSRNPIFTFKSTGSKNWFGHTFTCERIEVPWNTIHDTAHTTRNPDLIVTICLVQKKMKPKCDMEVKKSKAEVMLWLHFFLKIDSLRWSFRVTPGVQKAMVWVNVIIHMVWADISSSYQHNSLNFESKKQTIITMKDHLNASKYFASRCLSKE